MQIILFPSSFVPRRARRRRAAQALFRLFVVGLLILWLPALIAVAAVILWRAP